MNVEAANDPALTDRYRARFQEAIDFIERVFPYGFRRNPKERPLPELGSKPLPWDRASLSTSAPALSAATLRT